MLKQNSKQVKIFVLQGNPGPRGFPGVPGGMGIGVSGPKGEAGDQGPPGERGYGCDFPGGGIAQQIAPNISYCQQIPGATGPKGDKVS